MAIIHLPIWNPKITYSTHSFRFLINILNFLRNMEF